MLMRYYFTPTWAPTKVLVGAGVQNTLKLAKWRKNCSLLSGTFPD